MKLCIKITDAPAVPGGKALILCDEDGAHLPNQTGTTVSTVVGENSTIQVTFAVDGDAVRFV